MKETGVFAALIVSLLAGTIYTSIVHFEPVYNLALLLGLLFPTTLPSPSFSLFSLV